MVTRPGSRRAPRGFTLVELVVAIVVVGVGILGALATSTLALRHLREAEARGLAVRLASEVLDSVARHPNPTAGERQDGPRRVVWTVDASGRSSTISLIVVFPDGTAMRSLRFVGLHIRPLPLPRPEAEP